VWSDDASGSSVIETLLPARFTLDGLRSLVFHTSGTSNLLRNLLRPPHDHDDRPAGAITVSVEAYGRQVYTKRNAPR